MANHRYGSRGGYASNSPYGQEDRDRRGERGVFGRAGDELRSWFGFANDDPPGGYGRGVQSWGQANEGGNWGSGRNFGPQDHHYLSWRDRQIAELDRDYDEYCRENRQDFGSSFDDWRTNRRSAAQDMARADGVTSGTSGSTGSSAPETASGRRSRS